MHVGGKQEIIQSVLSAHLPFPLYPFVSIFSSLYIHCIYFKPNNVVPTAFCAHNKSHNLLYYT